MAQPAHSIGQVQLMMLSGGQSLENILAYLPIHSGELMLFNCPSPTEAAAVQFRYSATREEVDIDYTNQTRSDTTPVVYVSSTNFTYSNQSSLLPNSYTLPKPKEDRLLFIQPMIRAEFLICKKLYDGRTQVTLVTPSGGSVKNAAAWIHSYGLLEYETKSDGQVIGKAKEGTFMWTPYNYRGSKKQNRCSVIGHWSASTKTWTLYAQVLGILRRQNNGNTVYRVKRFEKIWESQCA